MEKRSRGESPIHNDVGRETDAEPFDGPTQQTLPDGVFAIARSIRFDVKRERQPRPHHGDQDHLVPIAHDLLVRITVGTTERTTRASAPSDGGSIHGQANATAGFKSLAALGGAKNMLQGCTPESGM